MSRTLATTFSTEVGHIFAKPATRISRWARNSCSALSEYLILLVPAQVRKLNMVKIRNSTLSSATLWHGGWMATESTASRRFRTALQVL